MLAMIDWKGMLPLVQCQCGRNDVQKLAQAKTKMSRVAALCVGWSLQICTSVANAVLDIATTACMMQGRGVV